MNDLILDPDLGFHFLPHGNHIEVQHIAFPARVDVRGTTGNMPGQLVDIAGNPAAGFVAAELVRQIDVDRALHRAKMRRHRLLFNPARVLMRAMKWLLILLAMLVAPPAAAQYRYNPAADYVTPGQDEPGYRAWVRADPYRPIYVKSFNDYLVNNGVGGVAPTWQLLRTASDWQKCGEQPFEVPPTFAWPNIVAALRYVGAFIEPVVGQVEPVSVYRNPSLNVCAKGAKTSTHLTAGAIDMVPLRTISREALMVTLCRIQLDKGSWNSIGLGFYKGLRFHIDSKKAREWGTAGARGGYGCAAVLAEGALRFGEVPVAPPPDPLLPTR